MRVSDRECRARYAPDAAGAMLDRGRQAELVAGLNALFGSRLRLAATETGMHVLLPLTPWADDRGLARPMAERGVVARPLSPYYAGRGRQQGLLLGFSAFTSAEIATGLARLSGLKGEIEGLMRQAATCR